MGSLKRLTSSRTRSPQVFVFFSKFSRPKRFKLSGDHALFHSTQRRMSSIPSEPESDLTVDPHVYTSGRWPRNDKLQRASRYIELDFDALFRRVVELCPGANSIADYEKKKGGFNRVFVFTKTCCCEVALSACRITQVDDQF